MIRALLSGPGLIHLFRLHVLDGVTQQSLKFWVFKLLFKLKFCIFLSSVIFTEVYENVVNLNY